MDNDKQLVTQAHDTDNYIKQLLTEMTNSAFKLGAALQHMKDSKGYIHLGYTYWEEYIQSLHHHRASIYNYLKVHEMWQKRLKHIIETDPEYNPVVYQIGYSNLIAISHIILDSDEDTGLWKYDDEKVKEWLHNAKENSREGLRELLGRNVNVLRGRAKLYKFQNTPEGLKIVLTSVKLPIDISWETMWKMWGGKHGEFIWKPSHE